MVDEVAAFFSPQWTVRWIFVLVLKGTKRELFLLGSLREISRKCERSLIAHGSSESLLTPKSYGRSNRGETMGSPQGGVVAALWGAL